MNSVFVAALHHTEEHYQSEHSQAEVATFRDLQTAVQQFKFVLWSEPRLEDKIKNFDRGNGVLDRDQSFENSNQEILYNLLRGAALLRDGDDVLRLNGLGVEYWPAESQVLSTICLETNQRRLSRDHQNVSLAKVLCEEYRRTEAFRCSHL